MKGWERVLEQLVPDMDEQRIVKDQLGYYGRKEGIFSWPTGQRDRFRASVCTWWEDYGARTMGL